MPTKRNIALCIVLTLVTCGIYGLYWLAKVNDEVNDICGVKGTSGICVILLSLVTCGIYGIHWQYKTGSELDDKLQKDGQAQKNYGLIFLVLCFFGLGIVSLAIAQSRLNEYAEQ